MDDLLSLAYGAAFPERGTSVVFSGLDALTPRFQAGDAWLRENAAGGREGFGWMTLPRRNVDDIQTMARWLATRESIIQVGAGGFALGSLMLNNALLPPLWNELPKVKRGGPRFFMAGGLDSAENHAIWELTDPESTSVVVVSRVGDGAETASNFLFFWEKLRDTLGEAGARERVIVVTDKEQGVLRAFVDETGCKSLILPGDVGEPFSVLTCAGLLTGWALGMDCAALLKGAGEMDAKLAAAGTVLENPAWVLAGLNVLHMNAGRNINVLMPCANLLERFGGWFAQLWGSSLGREGKGSTPVCALGTGGWHSQLQRYTAGPDDKFYTILAVEQGRKNIALPAAPERALKRLSPLYGRSLEELRGFEAKAAAAALRQAGRPVAFLSVPTMDPRRLGALIQFFEYVTAMTGYLLDVNPFERTGDDGLRRGGFEVGTQEVHLAFAGVAERTAGC